MKTAFLSVGGDRRQTLLCELLARRFPVYTLSVPGLPDFLPQEPVHMILPCPAFTPDGRVREGPEKEALIPYLTPEAVVFCAMPGAQLPWLEGFGVRVVDLLLDEAAAAENARLTAEAAICVTMQHTQRSLFRSRCAVLGYGRIGTVLARLLTGFGAQVTVFARNAAVRAAIRAQGYRAQSFSELPDADTELVFNTVPAQALPDAALRSLCTCCTWVELASAPGGLPPQAAFAFQRLGAPSLPGRLLPVSAAQVLCRAILRSLEELP